ncbi:MAG: type II secretion system F family protein [Actinomycetes bacterium]
MTLTLVVAAGLVTLAVLLMLKPVASVSRRVRPAQIVRLASGDHRLAAGPSRALARDQVATRRRNQWAALIAAVGVWALVGGPAGVVLGAALVVLGPAALARLEPRSVRHRRQTLEATAPMVADLLAACLESGASTAASVQAVARALEEPVESVLGNCVAQIQLGADPARVWGALAQEPELAPIARSILRSADSGAPLADLLLRTGDDLRSVRRARLEALARSAGIKAVGPLGVCFLPAFMLLGVVPLVASLVGTMLARG